MNLLAAELLKLRTTRPPYWLLLVTVGIAGLAAAGIVGSDSLDEDPALTLAQGAGFSLIFLTVLGILIVTNEYRHGTVMTTFLAEPRRVRVLAAKVATALLAGVTFALASAAVSAAVALPWLAARDQSFALDGQALEAVLRLALAYALSAALGVAIGAIVQSQVGAIVITFVWFLIVESVIGVVSSWLLTGFDGRDPLSPYLLGSVFGGVVGGQGSEFLHDGPTAATLAFVYVGFLMTIGAVAIVRRDP